MTTAIRMHVLHGLARPFGVAGFGTLINWFGPWWRVLGTGALSETAACGVDFCTCWPGWGVLLLLGGENVAREQCCKEDVPLPGAKKPGF